MGQPVESLKQKDNIVLVWDNILPYMVDRFQAISNSGFYTTLIQLKSNSNIYQKMADLDSESHIRTALPDNNDKNYLRNFFYLLKAILPTNAKYIFICDYQKIHVFMLSIFMRLIGKKVYMMNDSKFDDKPRHILREIVKSIFILPYHGILSNDFRSIEYWKFLGKSARRIANGYDTISIKRVTDLSLNSIEDNDIGPIKENEDFICVARLVTKKNIFMLIDAFKIYTSKHNGTKKLIIVGSGPLENELIKYISSNMIRDKVILKGWMEQASVAKLISRSCCLILPSTEEQFGLVVAEALALGTPVIVSENCGARDTLVRSGINGFVVEPDNPEGLAYFMNCIANDKALRSDMSAATRSFALSADAANFASGIRRLIGT